MALGQHINGVEAMIKAIEAKANDGFFSAQIGKSRSEVMNAAKLTALEMNLVDDTIQQLCSHIADGVLTPMTNWKRAKQVVDERRSEAGERWNDMLYHSAILEWCQAGYVIVGYLRGATSST